MLDIRGEFRLAQPTRVAPQELIDYFIVLGLGVIVDLKGSVYLLYLQQVLQSVADAAVGAEDVLLDEGSDGHLFKQSVHPTEEGILVLNVLLELGRTLIAEAEYSVDLSVLMRPPQKDDVFGEFDLQGEEEKNGLHALRPFIHIVTQEKIVGWLDIAVLSLVARGSEGFEQPIQLLHLAVDISEYLNRISQLF